MRNLLVTSLLLWFGAVAFAQGERPAYKTLSRTFENLYNRNSYDSIFGMFSADMKKALPSDKTKAFLAELKTSAGKILSLRFERYQSSYGYRYALYKTACERRTVLLSLSLDDAFKINGLLIQPYTAADNPVPEQNSVVLRLPFTDAWTVLWGGETKEQNYHVEVPVQQHAFDFIVTDSSGKSFGTDGKTNGDYYAFGKEILAPCDGEVVLAVDGIKDNVPGQMNPMFVTGNTVILKAAPNEYLVLAHFKQGTIRVKEGRKVKQGDVLGHCGNSGNSSEPHLHFHLQNVEDMTIATGIKCYFDRIHVNGKEKRDYSPLKGEVVQQ